MKVLTMGEVMIQLNPISSGPLRHVYIFEKHVAGSEGNVAIGLSRLGNDVSIVTSVGKDEFGKNIISVLRSEGVDLTYVIVDPNHPTGVYFIQRDFPFPGSIEVYYYRHNSAMAHFPPSYVNSIDLGGYEVFHISGITPMLSSNCEEASMKLLEKSIQANLIVSFDTNVRKKIFHERSAAILKPFIQQAHILFTSLQDMNFLLDQNNTNLEIVLNDFMRFFKLTDEKIIVIKQGSKGALVVNKGKQYYEPSVSVNVVDSVGAGDAFDAAFLSFFLEKEDVKIALKKAAVAGALVTTVRGDFEAFPDRSEIEKAEKLWGGEAMR